MDQGGGSRELDVAAIIERVKNDANGPTERAKRVLNALAATGQFTNWDAICFAAEYLGAMASTMEWLRPPTRELIRLVYIAQYIRSESMEWADHPLPAPTQPSTTDKV